MITGHFTNSNQKCGIIVVYRITALSLGREIDLIRYDPEAIDDFSDGGNPFEGGSIVLTVTPLHHLVGRE
jgi:hypothetical protein